MIWGYSYMWLPKKAAISQLCTECLGPSGASYKGPWKALAAPLCAASRRARPRRCPGSRPTWRCPSSVGLSWEVAGEVYLSPSWWFSFSPRGLRSAFVFLLKVTWESVVLLTEGRSVFSSCLYSPMQPAERGVQPKCSLWFTKVKGRSAEAIGIPLCLSLFPCEVVWLWEC